MVHAKSFFSVLFRFMIHSIFIRNMFVFCLKSVHIFCPFQMFYICPMFVITLHMAVNNNIYVHVGQQLAYGKRKDGESYCSDTHASVTHFVYMLFILFINSVSRTIWFWLLKVCTYVHIYRFHM